MIPYFIAAFMLFLIMIGTNRTSIFPFLVASIFAGLRYQIGYDWLAYDDFFRSIGTFSDYLTFGTLGATQTFEIYYVILNIFSKSIGIDISVLLGTISVFNLYVIYRAAKRLCPESVNFTIFLYFCVALIPIQLNIIRQSLASSIILIGLMLALNGRRLAGAAVGMNAIAFHVSTVLFVPLFLLASVKPNKLIVYSVCVASFTVLLSSQSITQYMLSLVESIDIPFISGKLASYENIEDARTSIGAAMYLLVNLGFLFTFMRAQNYVKSTKAEPDVNIAIWLTLYMIVSLLAFSGFPSIWNRMMAVALPWQLPVFFRVCGFSRMTFGRHTFVNLAVGVGGIFVLTYELTRPDVQETFRYHSMIQVLAGDEGDGRFRTMNAISAIEMRAAAK